MADCENKDTSSKPTKQLPHEEIVSSVRKIIAHKFTERDLMELRSYVNGLLMVTKEK